jgi:hypothetical protein
MHSLGAERMSGAKRAVKLVRASAVLCAGLAVSACASFHPFQSPEHVIIRAGSFEKADLRTKDYAGHFVPYAAISVRAYGENGLPGERWEQLVKATPDADVWLSRWSKLWHHEGALPCPQGEGRCGLMLPGLGYQVWRRSDCGEMVIAFRGTNFDQIDDWLSNFHFATRILPIADQYRQVQDNISGIVDRMMRHCPGSRARIIAVGHSLGGGLAQQAAYVDRRIRTVYAFDPSFVTGASDHPERSALNSKGHKFDRTYEHGEILAFPRFILRQFDPPSACDPQIRTVRFNLLKGTILAQHSMVTFTAEMIKKTGTPKLWRATAPPPLPDAPETNPVTGRCRVEQRIAHWQPAQAVDELSAASRTSPSARSLKK